MLASTGTPRDPTTRFPTTRFPTRFPTTRFPTRLLAALTVAVAAAAIPAAATAQAPSVEKIEPANWWVGMQRDTVQLLVYGDALDGVTARFLDHVDGPRVLATHAAASPAHLFIDIHVPEGTVPGAYELELTRGADTHLVAYPVLAREPREGRHRGFGPEDVVYLIMPDRFANAVPANDRPAGIRDELDRSDPGARHGGDLQGIIDRLDYLADLGVTALWLNPVLENRGRGSYHGYAATDLYRIDPRLGTNEDYRRLVQEAHRRGLKVIFDHISNHIGVEHPWLADLPTETWLHGSVEDHLSDAHYMMSIADPHAAPATEEALESFWFVDGMPDLDQRDPHLAMYLIQNMIWWIEYTGLDGIREDTYPYPDQRFLADWAEAIRTEYPQLNIVGEIWSGEPAFTALFQADSPLPRDFETHLPTVMDFALSDAWRAYIAGVGTLEGVYRVLAQDFLYADPLHVMTFVDNHDMARAMYLAEHGQGAGRGAGGAGGGRGDGAVRRVKQALTMLLTTRGIPQILYGTEIGMVGGESHVELRADMPGGWPGDERSVFDPDGRTAEENDIFDHLRRLLHIRRDHPALARGRLIHVPPTWNDHTYAYIRTLEDETVLVVVNGYPDARHVDVAELTPHLPAGGRVVDLLTGEEGPLDAQAGIRVDGWGARVLRVE